MYLLINKTKKITVKHVGSFPGNMLEEWLNAGDQVIVVSTYSNTIKVPYSVYSNGETEWEYEDFPFNPHILNQKDHISNAEEVIWSQDGKIILYAGPSASAPSNEELEELEEKYLRATDPTACWDGE